jgi:hypothetical protein
MFVNRNFFGTTVPYLIINTKPQNTMKFKKRHGEFEQGCVLRERYTATDALPPILPACRQPLLPACVFVTGDTVRHLRRFLFGKFVRDERRWWTDLLVMRGVREPICSWWEAFVNRGYTVVSCALVGITALGISWDPIWALILYIRIYQLKGICVEILQMQWNSAWTFWYACHNMNGIFFLLLIWYVYDIFR